MFSPYQMADESETGASLRSHAEEAQMPRNPTWHRNELILALELYLRRGLLREDDPEVIALSEFLRHLDLHPPEGNPDTFRSPTSVKLKLANFAAVDPDYQGVGLQQGGRRDAEIWDEFAIDRERLVQETAAIRARAASHPSEAATIRRYWALQANPNRYRIEDAVQDLTVDWWKTNGRPLRVGDRVIIWKSQGHGKHKGPRGVVALGEVISPLMARDKVGEPYWVDPSFGLDSDWRVKIRYVHAPNLPLWYDDWAHPILAQLSVSRGQGTVFNVTTEQWHAVIDAAGGWPEESPEIEDARDAVAIRAGRTRSGQGFRVNAEQRQAIEQYAMAIAKAHYRAQGWTEVEDVSLRNPFDLRCSRPDGSELRVEVKGTTGTGTKILLTPNEVRHALKEYPNVALFIVANIVLSQENEDLRPSGGESIVREPWELDSTLLSALGYEYTVP
jgi:hypothetical protein